MVSAQAGSLNTDRTSLPAVSAANGKLDAEYGNIGYKSLAAAAGSLSLPFAERFAAQVDGLAGRWNSAALTGAALHLFWRDPARALIGVYASGLHWSGNGGMNASRAGLEAELYLHRFSLAGFLGGEFGDITDRFSSRLRLNWYPLDNLELSLGGEYLSGRAGLLLGGEWQLPSSQVMGPALFVRARVSDRDHAAVWGGLHIYFGAGKSLIRRHREDDPENNLTDDAGMFSATTTQGTSGSGGSGSGSSSGPPPIPPPCCGQL